jgi:two-component system chemotaxis sensor kinase CheA
MVKDPYRFFRIEAAELLEQIGKSALDLEKGPAADAVMRLLRQAHTLKGAARVVRVAPIADLAHELEDVLAPHREDGTVPRDKVDRILACIDAMGEALKELGDGVQAPPAGDASPVPEAAPRQRIPTPPRETPRLARADLAEVAQVLEGLGEIGNELETLARVDAGLERLRGLSVQLGRQSRQHALTPARLDAIANELQVATDKVERALQQGTGRALRELGATRDAAQRLRLVPVTDIFLALERTARDAAHQLGKEVVFEARGGDVRLEGALLDAVQDALIQLVRNAVAHGIETPDRRRAAGKPGAGRVTVEVRRQGYDALFACSDDGAGFDAAALRRVLAERGQHIEESDPDALFRRLLAGGISTVSAVSEIAGRGIGLNLVGDALRRLNGTVQARSEPGLGATLSLRVPLTLAALQVLMVQAEGQTLALPLDAVLRTLRLAASDILHLPDGEAIVDEGGRIPLLRLPGARLPDKPVTVAVVRHREGSGAGRLALAVERLAGIERVVLQPLPALTPAEATVLGLYLDLEGNPRLVLDPERFDVRAPQRVPHAPRERHTILIVDDSLTTRMLESSILESAGYAVEMAASAEEGLSMADKRPYALFLVDVEMPGMDGFAFVERTRADAATGNTPCILVSSRNAAEDFARGRAAAASDYIVKGEFDQVRFLQRVAELVAGNEVKA